MENNAQNIICNDLIHVVLRPSHPTNPKHLRRVEQAGGTRQPVWIVPAIRAGMINNRQMSDKQRLTPGSQTLIIF